MLLTDGDTITKQDVINAYEDDKEILTSNNNEKGIIESTEPINTVDKNLAQMEIELLRKVLVEENYNYTKAAKRLGIHRTTLWRKLKINKNIFWLYTILVYSFFVAKYNEVNDKLQHIFMKDM